MINLPIIYRFFRIIYRFASIGSIFNLPIIYRQNRINYRSRRYAAVFSFCSRRANHQLIVNPKALIITPASADPSTIHRRFGLIHRSGRRSGPPNRKVIVNRFAVIVNPVALNLSTIDQQNGQIHQLGRRVPGGRFLESSDHPTCPQIPPSDPTPMNSQLSATWLDQIRNRTRPSSLQKSVRKFKSDETCLIQR